MVQLFYLGLDRMENVTRKSSLSSVTTNVDFSVDQSLGLDLALYNECVQLDPVAVNKLATGLISVFQPGLEKIKKQLNELTMKQSTMILQMAEEGSNLQPQRTAAITDMHSKVELYSGKLMGMKKDMHQTAEKLAVLKKRALWLQSMKQKEALQQEHQKELQLQREQELIAKPLV